MADNEKDFAEMEAEMAEILGWDALEYPKYRRGRLWYAGALLIGGGLLIYAVLSANFLFALIVVMVALMAYLSSVVEPRKIRFSIVDTGIRLGRAFYPYRDIGRFWFIYEPPEVQALYLEFKNSFRPRLTIDLGNANPNQVRQALGGFLREDFTEEEEPFADFLGRVLKI